VLRSMALFTRSFLRGSLEACPVSLAAFRNSVIVVAVGFRSCP
jgi:hypothetical protein